MSQQVIITRCSKNCSPTTTTASRTDTAYAHTACTATACTDTGNIVRQSYVPQAHSVDANHPAFSV